MIMSMITLLFSIFQIINWKKDSNKTKKETVKIEKITDIKEKEDSSNTEIIGQDIPKDDPYWDYIKMNLMDVNFKDLKKKNSSVAGWIQVLGTNINYPYVWTTDNEYYLTHSFDKSKNYAGWVFLDYRNHKSGLSKNNIIYAHGRKDHTMFGSLNKILTNGWFLNSKNHVVRMSTETENTLWQVFSVYRIPNTSDYIQVNFNNDDEFSKFGSMILSRSKHNFNTSIDGNDTILTLSTCYDDYEKVVLHAKLIKREKK